MLVWYILTDVYLIRKYKVKNTKNTVYMLLQVAIFYAVTFINILWLSAIVYLAAFVITLLCFYFKEVKWLFCKLFKRSKQIEAPEQNAEEPHTDEE